MVVVNLKTKDKPHYPFCQDLGQKKFFSLEKVLGEGQDISSVHKEFMC